MFGLTTRLMFPKIKLPRRFPFFRESSMTTTTKAEKAKVCVAPSGQSQQISAVTGCSEDSICQDAIRERAYLLWEQAGYPTGDGVDFWLEAEQQLKDN